MTNSATGNLVPRPRGNEAKLEEASVHLGV